MPTLDEILNKINTGVNAVKDITGTGTTPATVTPTTPVTPPATPEPEKWSVTKKVVVWGSVTIGAVLVILGIRHFVIKKK